MWAIRNKNTKKWLYGTDFRLPYTQHTSFDRVMLFFDEREARYAFKSRQCGKDFEVVAVRLEAVEDITDDN